MCTRRIWPYIKYISCKNSVYTPKYTRFKPTLQFHHTILCLSFSYGKTGLSCLPCEVNDFLQQLSQISYNFLHATCVTTLYMSPLQRWIWCMSNMAHVKYNTGSGACQLHHTIVCVPWYFVCQYRALTFAP
jgi:hypothetical protein